MSKFLAGIEPTEKEKEFYEAFNLSEKVKIVKVGATWCPPCVAASPILKNFKKENDVDYFDLDIGGKNGQENEFVHLCQNYRISSIPVFFLVDKDNNIVLKEDSVYEFLKLTKEYLNGEKVES